MRQAEIDDILSLIDVNKVKHLLFIWIDEDGQCGTASNETDYPRIFNILHHALGVYATLEQRELDAKE